MLNWFVNINHAIYIRRINGRGVVLVVKVTPLASITPTLHTVGERDERKEKKIIV